MTERPILFSAPMVRAIIAGTKSQTRRAMRRQFCHDAEPEEMCAVNEWGHQITGHSGKWWDATRGDHTALARCPYGQPGDRLWTKETWQYGGWTEDGVPRIDYKAGGDSKWCHHIGSDAWAERLVDIWADLSKPENYNIDGRAADRRWRPAIHMPRWASRITLEVTGVRVERLQDISEADAIAEGITHSTLNDPRVEYRRLWEDINGAGSWDRNPWVWVIEFVRAAAAIGQAMEQTK